MDERETTHSKQVSSDPAGDGCGGIGKETSVSGTTNTGTTAVGTVPWKTDNHNGDRCFAQPPMKVIYCAEESVVADFDANKEEDRTGRGTQFQPTKEAAEDVAATSFEELLGSSNSRPEDCGDENVEVSSGQEESIQPVGLPLNSSSLPTTFTTQLPGSSSPELARTAHEVPLPHPELPLSPEDISEFEENGFVMLKRAFDPDVASACRDSLWKRLRGEGIQRDYPSTWVSKISLAEIYGTQSSPKKRRGHPWSAVLSTRLKSAIDQLAGAGSWENFGCGWWMVTFPGFSQPPWGVEGKWHVDGAHFRHYPHSREIGLLPIFLFSDVRPQGGGTAVLRGSHKKVAEILWNRAGTTGMTGPEVSRAARELLLPAPSEDVIETTGSAGDVLLTHPLLLHARSTNLAPVEECGVRLMCHPAVPLKHHLNLHAPPETFSVLERVMWRTCPANFREADRGAVEGKLPPMVPTPAQCDHSTVQLTSTPINIKQQGVGDRKRGRHKNDKEQDLRPRTKIRQWDAQQQHPQDKGGCSNSLEFGVCSAKREAVGGAEQPCTRSAQLTGTESATVPCAEAPAKWVYKGDACDELRCSDVESEHADTNACTESTEEVDAAVMAAMGFSVFGRSRR